VKGGTSILLCDPMETTEYLPGEVVEKETKNEILEIYRDKSRFWIKLLEYENIVASKCIDFETTSTIFRVEAPIPFNATLVFDMWADFTQHQDWDPFTSYVKVLHEFDSRNQLVYHVQYFNMPVPARDFVIFRTISARSENPLVIAYRSVSYPVTPPKEGILRGGYIFINSHSFRNSS
jgi:hypothetical protein